MATKSKSPPASSRWTVAELKAELDKRTADLRRLAAERDEAIAQRTAIAEVLQVINSSPGDFTPVFEAMLEKAMRLCETDVGYFYIRDGEYFQPAAACGDPGFSEWLLRRGTIRPVPNSPLSRITSGEAAVEIRDVKETEAYRAGGAYRELVDISNARTQLAMPLRKDGNTIGVIAIYRKEVRPF
jgi:two-component system NtrC family sensor kinase